MSKNVPALLNAILGLAEIDSEEALDVEFVVRILAGIPFQNDEPLHLIYHLTRFIGRPGSTLAPASFTLFDRDRRCRGR